MNMPGAERVVLRRATTTADTGQRWRSVRSNEVVLIEAPDPGGLGG